MATLFDKFWYSRGREVVFYVKGQPVYAQTVQTAKRGNFATKDNEYTACLCTTRKSARQ